MKKANCSLYETFNYGMGDVRNIHAASTKFLSCWLHHKLRLQRPMAARNLSEMAQSVHNKVLTLLVVYMINERMSYEYRITY